MSRVAKAPIAVPAGVEIKLVEQVITVKGKLGELSLNIHPAVKVAKENDQLKVATVDKNNSDLSKYAGTMRVLINNMVHGVSQGFERKLTMVGVGYRAKAQGDSLNLTVGFSHPVDMKMPKGVNVVTPAQTEIVLSGADKQQVCQVAANIRAIRPPEPYKGKGIRYSDEIIVRKEGKKK